MTERERERDAHVEYVVNTAGEGRRNCVGNTLVHSTNITVKMYNKTEREKGIKQNGKMYEKLFVPRLCPSSVLYIQ